jgi:superfamily I DNA/RNA helicase
LKTEKLLRTYDDKVEFLEAYKEFCLSDSLSFSEFIKNAHYPSDFIKLGEKYLQAMAAGKIDCTHEFYLKLYHLQLANGTISYDPFDIIMLDEAGDLNLVTLAIFNLLPAKRKIMVGDPHQNIYSFNHTINCFKIMEDEGTLLPMSQSFRVADHIAEKIEKFCRKYLHEDMSFQGVPIRDTTISSRAYIARTNASLIGKMMELNATGTAYGLTRKAKQIFDLPLLICSLKHRGFIPNPEYKHLQSDVDHYYDNLPTLSHTFKSLFSYLLALHEDDQVLVNTIKLVSRHSKAAIIECFDEARKHEKACQSYTLGTCHSMKGLEVDEVTIAPDLNESISDLLQLITMNPDYEVTETERNELNLYYVATSRARKALINAAHL